MIGQRIKKLRLKKNMTLSELATLSNISKSYLSYMERDLKNNPSLEVIKKISTPLNTSVHYLLTGEEEDVLHFLLQRYILNFEEDELKELEEFILFLVWKRKHQK